MKVAIFSGNVLDPCRCGAAWVYTQLLAQGTACFRRATGLNANDFHQIDNAARVFNLILFTGQDLYLNRHGRVGFLGWYRDQVSAVLGHETRYRGRGKTYRGLKHIEVEEEFFLELIDSQHGRDP